MCSENKGADQLGSYCEADLRFCFRRYKMFCFHDAAQMFGLGTLIKSGQSDN